MTFLDDVHRAQTTLENIIKGEGKYNPQGQVTLADVYAVLDLQLKQLRNLTPKQIELPDAYKVRYVKLDNSGLYSDTLFEYGGSYIYVVESRGRDAFCSMSGVMATPRLTAQTTYSLKLENTNNDSIQLVPGMTIRAKHFDKFYVTANYTSVKVDLLLMISDVDIAEFVSQPTLNFIYDAGTGEIWQRCARVDSDGKIMLSALPAGTNNIGIVTDSVVDKTLVTRTYDWTGAVTAQAIWTPASGKKFCLTDMYLSTSAACTVTLFDNTDSTTYRICKLALAANSGFIDNRKKPYLSAAANNVLKLTTSATGGYLTVCGYEV